MHNDKQILSIALCIIVLFFWQNKFFTSFIVTNSERKYAIVAPRQKYYLIDFIVDFVLTKWNTATGQDVFEK